MEDPDDIAVIAFDGDCLMCSRSVRFLAENDPHHRLRFVRLQDPRGRRMEAAAGIVALSTVLVEADGRIYSRSAALLRALHAMGGPWRLLATLARLVPRPLRDKIYAHVATRRHRWFRRREACSLPSPALIQRMLTDGDP